MYDGQDTGIYEITQNNFEKKIESKDLNFKIDTAELCVNTSSDFSTHVNTDIEFLSAECYNVRSFIHIYANIFNCARGGGQTRYMC